MSLAVNFNPPPSVAGFIRDDAFVSLIVGPVGSTKTSAGLMKIVYHAKQMAPCTDGIRRSRAIWVRNTRQMLMDTSVQDFLKWFPDGQAGSFARSDLKFTLRFDDVECEVLFRWLDESADVKRVLSLQTSFAILDEFREIHPDVYEGLQGRLGRYPDKMLVPPRAEWGVDDKGMPIGGCVREDGSSNRHLWGMTNPPDMDTYWENLLTAPPKNVSVYFQPSGLSAEADWLEYLPSDYYDQLAEGKSQDWVDVYVHAKFGKSLAGDPVFRSFKTDFHVAKGGSLNVLASPVLIGIDAGLSPAAVIGQLDYQSRLVIHDSVPSESMGALRFVREKLKPLLANKFPSKPTQVIIDPAAFQRTQTDERTVADIFRAEGFPVKAGRTNDITARIAAVDSFLTRTVDAKPAILFDGTGAASLVLALRSKYRYKITAKGEKEEKPDKTHPWSDLADALQYLCLHADNGATFGISRRAVRKEVKPRAYTYV